MRNNISILPHENDIENVVITVYWLTEESTNNITGRYNIYYYISIIYINIYNNIFNKECIQSNFLYKRTLKMIMHFH